MDAYQTIGKYVYALRMGHRQNKTRMLNNHM